MDTDETCRLYIEITSSICALQKETAKFAVQMFLSSGNSSIGLLQPSKLPCIHHEESNCICRPDNREWFHEERDDNIDQRNQDKQIVESLFLLVWAVTSPKRRYSCRTRQCSITALQISFSKCQYRIKVFTIFQLKFKIVVTSARGWIINMLLIGIWWLMHAYPD